MNKKFTDINELLKWLEVRTKEEYETYLYRPQIILLLNYIKEFQQENQQLKQKYEMQKDSNKLLCKAITCDDCDCKVCEAHKQNIKYKSVLDEIREQLKLERKIALSLNKPYTVSVIDKLLDKVKE